MKSFLPRIVPALVGLLFVYSAGHKILSPAEAIGAVESLEFSGGVARWAVFAVAVVEAYLGVILLLRLNLRYGMSLASIVLFGFTVFLFYLSTLANPPSCGCLGLTGLFENNQDAARFGIVRNCVLLLLLKLAYDRLDDVKGAGIPAGEIETAAAGVD